MRDPDSGSSFTPPPTNDYSGITFSYNPTPSSGGYGALSQADLKKQIAYLESLRPASRSVGDVGSWRIGEELSVAKLYLDDKKAAEEENAVVETFTPTFTPSAAYLVASTPQTPPPPPPPVAAPAIKTATPQYILPGDDVMPAELIADLIFENIGGQEILSLSRHDLINGEYVSNQLIANIKKINNENDPKNMFIAQTSNKYFNNFAIKLNAKIPNVGNGPNGSNVYLDDDGSIVVEFVNILPGEQTDIEIVTDGIIYEVGN